MKNWDHNISNPENQSSSSEWDELINSSATDEEAKDKLLNINDWLAHGRIDEERANVLRDEVLGRTATTPAETAPVAPEESSPEKVSHSGANNQSEQGQGILDAINRRTDEYLNSEAGRREKGVESVFDNYMDWIDRQVDRGKMTEDKANKLRNTALDDTINKIDNLREGYQGSNKETDKLQAGRIDLINTLRAIANQKQAEPAPETIERPASPSLTKEVEPPRSDGEGQSKAEEVHRLEDENQADQKTLAGVEHTLEELKRLRDASQVDREKLNKIRGQLKELHLLEEEDQADQESLAEIENRIDKLNNKLKEQRDNFSGNQSHTEEEDPLKWFFQSLSDDAFQRRNGNSSFSFDFPVNDLDVSGEAPEPTPADHIEDSLAYESRNPEDFEDHENPQKTREKSKKHSDGLLSWLLRPRKSRKLRKNQPAQPVPEMARPQPLNQPPRSLR